MKGISIKQGLLPVILAVTVSLFAVVAFVNATTTISTNIVTGGSIAASTTLQVTGAQTNYGAFTVSGTGATTLGGALSAAGVASFAGVVNASSTVNVTGAPINYGALTVSGTGATTLCGALSVTGISTFTGLGTFLGGATTTSLTLLNGETISNATDGVIQLFGTSSTTGITLLNGETITNATNGIAAVGGNLLINGARTNDISGEEKFLNVTGNLTGTGDGSTNAKTWLIQASATRLAGANTVNGDMDEAILKGSITNKATANEANYIMRGLNIGATNRDGGNVNKLHGGLISATQKADSPVVTDLWGLGLKVEQDSGNATVPTNIYGLNVEYDVVMASPTNSAGVRGYDNSDTGLTGPLAGFQVSASALASDWQYGLVIDTGSVSSADVKLSGAGAVTPLIMSGAGAPSAGACTANTLGSIYLRTDPASADTALYVCTSASTWTAALIAS